MKFILNFSIAIGLSFVLFVGMSKLIDSTNKKIETEKTPIIQFDHVEIDNDLKPIERKPFVKPPELKLLTDNPTARDNSQRPQPQLTKPIDVSGMKFSGVGIFQEFAIVGHSGEEVLNGSESLPQIRVEPRYPTQAAYNGTEGFVTFKFDIDKWGAPTNIQLIDEKPKGIFERSGRKALMKWKYTPKIVDGNAVEVLDNRVTLEFKLSDA